MKVDCTAITSPADECFTEAGITRKASVYLYPLTPYVYKQGGNNYILKVQDLLNKDFTVINKVTKLGILDILLKLHKTDIVYLNWITDLADKRFGYAQVPILFLILVLCRIFRIRIAWFVHNDGSHFSKNFAAKKLIRRMMMFFSDVTFSHSNELSIAGRLKNHHVFEHPVEENEFVSGDQQKDIDLLIWGSVSPYKGVAAFVQFNAASNTLRDQNIVIAGKFSSEQFFDEVKQFAQPNISFRNRIQSDEELEDLFRRSRYVLFCYRSPSVLGSAALCKSISYGTTVIGPDLGAFRELGRKGLIYTYNRFEDLAGLLAQLKTSGASLNKESLHEYIRATSWKAFGAFLSAHLQPTPKEHLHSEALWKYLFTRQV